MADQRTYAINEYFCSPQGEGVRAGTINLFLRFAGCNLACNGETIDGIYQPVCDTEFASYRKLTADQIIEELRDCAPQIKSIILTGGEPALQIDQPLIAALKAAGYYLAIETNGTKELPRQGADIDWITVSPKTAEHTLCQLIANEVKYVRAIGHGIPRPKVQAEYRLISPACEPNGVIKPETIDWCINLIKENPDWRLSVQQHKLWRVR